MLLRRILTAAVGIPITVYVIHYGNWLFAVTIILLALLAWREYGNMLLQKNIAGRIIRLFKRYHISPQAVILEITEEQAFSNAESSMYNIEQLHKFGFRIAIDDFGTGYANYERLKRLQADIIKIDGVFVKDIVTNTLDAMIVRSITDLAKAKSLSVVAEFVETQQQQALLHKLGVQYLQGYLIGRPQPLAD